MGATGQPVVAAAASLSIRATSRRRSKLTGTIRPTSTNAALPKNAAWNPSTSAWAWEAPCAFADLLAARVERIARPSGVV
jgi:hypothetical protein